MVLKVLQINSTQFLYCRKKQENSAYFQLKSVQIQDPEAENLYDLWFELRIF